MNEGYKRRVNSIENRIFLLIDDLIIRFANDKHGMYHLPEKVVQAYKKEFAALWFEKNNQSFEFMEYAPSLSIKLMRYLKDDGDREETKQDIMDEFENIIFSFYEYEIREFIYKRVTEFEYELCGRWGMKLEMDMETGWTEWV